MEQPWWLHSVWHAVTSVLQGRPGTGRPDAVSPSALQAGGVLGIVSTWCCV